jgi:ABC-type amino acid transport substrate-binding protein
MMRRARTLAVLIAAGLLAACATVPRFEAAGDIHAFLVSIRDGDQQTFDRHVDRPALKAQLKSRLIASESEAHGAGSLQALGAVLAGPLVDVGVDALVQPQTFRAVALQLGYAPDRPIPNQLQISAFLKLIGDGEVCVVTRHDGPCTLVFRNEDGTWRLIGYEGDIGRLMRGRHGG